MKEPKTSAITRIKTAIDKAKDLNSVKPEIIAFLDSLLRARKQEQNAAEKLGRALNQKIYSKS